MMRALKIALLAAIVAGAVPARAQAPGKAATVSVAQFRAQLESARQQLRALETRSGGGKRDASKILKALDKAQIVRRADGATQSAPGNGWGALAAGAAPLGGDSEANIKALRREEVALLRRDVELELAELDRWNTRTDGAYYKPVDAGKIVRELESSGQIRTGPPWLQAQIAALWKRVSDAFKAFWDWLNGLFPTGSAAPVSTTAGGVDWLQLFFWAAILALLGWLGFLAYRAFSGNVRWGRRARKIGADELQSEDAELLLLPPDELSQRAAQFAREGNFREALRHRYIALLLRLDGRGIWHYDARRTNWEHIAALRREAAKTGNQNGAIVTPLADLTRRFDRVRYGGALCDATDWQRFESDAGALEAGALEAGARELAEVKG